jgi:hypothetical protein
MMIWATRSASAAMVRAGLSPMARGMEDGPGGDLEVLVGEALAGMVRRAVGDSIGHGALAYETGRDQVLAERALHGNESHLDSPWLCLARSWSDDPYLGLAP